MTDQSESWPDTTEWIEEDPDNDDWEDTAGPRPLPPTARVMGATLVGLGAVLQPKADPEAHWSEPNQITLITEFEASAGPGPDLDVSAVPAEAPAPAVSKRPGNPPQV